MTLFWDPAGPLLRYERGVLKISDLNPEIKTMWRMSGWRCILAALRRS